MTKTSPRRAVRPARFELRLAAVGTLLFLIFGGDLPWVRDNLAFWPLVLLAVWPEMLCIPPGLRVRLVRRRE